MCVDLIASCHRVPVNLDSWLKNGLDTYRGAGYTLDFLPTLHAAIQLAAKRTRSAPCS